MFVKRRLFSLLAGVSLLLCVVLILMWARSKWIPDEVKYAWSTPLAPFRASYWIFQSDDGVLFARLDVIEFDAQGFAAYRPAHGWSYEHQGPPFQMRYVYTNKSLARDLGFDLEIVDNTGVIQKPSESIFAIGAPYWLLVSLTALLPLKAFRGRSRRFGKGCCTHCGYDLRATPDYCPECGMVPPK